MRALFGWEVAHEEAMDLAQASDRTRRQGDRRGTLRRLLRALRFEAAALAACPRWHGFRDILADSYRELKGNVKAAKGDFRAYARLP